MTVEITRLSNGLTVVTDRMAHVESAAVGVWVGTGSRAERDHEHGISHLLEHMAFKGTSRMSARDIAETIEAVGGDLNAATSTETTAYHARVLGEDMPLALAILSDILTDPAFEAGELEREKHVIVQEIGAAEDVPEEIVFDAFPEVAWKDQAIGRPILGTRERVRGFDAGALRDYLGRRYRAGDMVLAAAGAVDHAAIVREAERRFSAFPEGPADPPAPARYTGGTFRDTRAINEVQVMLGFESVPLVHPDHFVAQVAATAVGGGMSSRLFQSLREERGLCYTVSAFHWGFTDTGLFAAHAATGEEDVDELATVMLDEIARAADDMSAEETERGKAQLKAGLLMARESSSARIGMMARQLLTRGRVLPPEELVASIEAVDAAAVRRFLGETLTRGLPTVATVGAGERVPDAERVADRFGARAPAH